MLEKKDRYNHLNKTLSDIEKRLSELLSPFLKTTEDLNLALLDMQSQVNKAAKKVAKAIERMPDAIRISSRKAGENGWYLSENMEMSMITSIQSMHKYDIEKYMKAFWTNGISAAEEELVKRYPKRKGILRKAFQAHRSGDYELAIPVFLAQADGICQEQIGVQLYSRESRSGKPKIKTVVDGLDIIQASFMEPMKIPMPINFNRQERKGMVGLFNRHTVLHGESVDYGTEVNSLKAISLLSFIGWILVD